MRSSNLASLCLARPGSGRAAIDGVPMRDADTIELFM
jgi:hypothetical protein